MTSFSDGRLLLREFSTLAEAHLWASQLSSAMLSPLLRLIDISMTVKGAWACAWSSAKSGDSSGLLSNDELARKFSCDVLNVESSLLDALLSLGPKPSVASKFIGIIESSSIAEVFRGASFYANQGHTLLEIRIKRGGSVGGAIAFLAIETEQSVKADSKFSPLTLVPLIGDYRRYFL